MRKALCLFYSPFKLLIILIFSPIITILYWAIILFTAIPLSVFRRLLSFCARLRDPDLCKIVNSMGHVISRDYDDWYCSPSHLVTVVVRLKASIPKAPLHEMQELASKKWVLKSDVNHNTLEYPELQQYFTKRWGYLFLKWDRNFDISNHVSLYTNKELLPNPETDVVNETTFIRIWETLMTKPLVKKRSPWEIILLRNCAPPKNNKNDFGEFHTALIFRVHHALCDGASIHKLLLALTDNGLDDFENDLPIFKKAPACTKSFLHLQALLCGPTSVVCKFAQGIDCVNPLHRPLGKLTGQYYVVKTTLTVETIKRITRAHLGVLFHSVLQAAIAGAIRNYILEKEKKVPLSPVRMGMPIPLPGHSFKLRNEFLIKIVDLPIDKKTPRQRLFAIEKRLMQRDPFMAFMGQSWQIFGLFPSKLLRILSSKSAVTANYSAIRGLTKKLTAGNGGWELVDLAFTIGLGTDDCGMTCTTITYIGKLHIILTVDRGIAKSRDAAQHLLNLIEKELQELEYGDSTNL